MACPIPAVPVREIRQPETPARTRRISVQAVARSISKRYGGQVTGGGPTVGNEERPCLLQREASEAKLQQTCLESD